VTDRNPMVNAPGTPTLVGLPTWFWVRDPLAVGEEAGNLDVTASVEQPDGLVWAKVVATTSGLSISSQYGGTLNGGCSPKQALTDYPNHPKAFDKDACTVEFTHAEVNLPITATTDWNASWTGSNNDGVHPLDFLRQQFNSTISVAEVQNIVAR
jgi:hypothetical protein